MVFPMVCLAASGTFPTEERVSLKELIRKCLASKWHLLFCTLRRLSRVMVDFSGDVLAYFQGATYISQNFSQ